MEKISKELSYQLLAWGIIDHDDIPIYQYGIYNGIIIFINFLTAVVIGLFTGKILDILMFLSAFISLRSFTGGVHLDNKLFCYISSNLLLLIPAYIDELGMVIACRIGELTNPVWWLFLAVSVVIILCLAPMDSKKRKLDQAEKKRFRTIGFAVLSLQLVIIILLRHFRAYHVSYIIGISIALIAALMLIGKLQLNQKEKME